MILSNGTKVTLYEKGVATRVISVCVTSTVVVNMGTREKYVSKDLLTGRKHYSFGDYVFKPYSISMGWQKTTSEDTRFEWLENAVDNVLDVVMTVEFPDGTKYTALVMLTNITYVSAQKLFIMANLEVQNLEQFIHYDPKSYLPPAQENPNVEGNEED